MKVKTDEQIARSLRKSLRTVVKEVQAHMARSMQDAEYVEEALKTSDSTSDPYFALRLYRVASHEHTYEAEFVVYLAVYGVKYRDAKSLFDILCRNAISHTPELNPLVAKVRTITGVKF